MGFIFIIIIFIVLMLFLAFYKDGKKIRSSPNRDILDYASPSSDSEKEYQVVQLAKKKHGRITPLEIVAECHISIQEAEDILKKFVKKGYVDLQVSETGKIFYEFPDFFPEQDQ